LYLEALKRCRFRIIYIHNGLLDFDVRKLLGEYCEKVFCRENVGQDMGAWKDGYLYIHGIKLLDRLDWLLMCNDSNFYVGGASGDLFVNLFSGELDNGDSDLIALNKNYELWQHFQSFFLCYRKPLFACAKFHSFWVKNRPLDNRYYAINNGEIRLTREVLGTARAKILYSSIDLVARLNRLSEEAGLFYTFLPQNALYLAPRDDADLSLGMLGLQRILTLLDHHNPSHVYALLFSYFLNSPFMKKDIYRQGIFSIPQIYSYLREIGVEQDCPTLCQEIIRSLQVGGSNVSYLRYPKLALRKGINPQSKLYSGYGEVLDGLGLKGSG